MSPSLSGTSDPRHPHRDAGIALSIVGSAGLALGVGWDVVRPGGTPGLGWRQLLLCLIGSAMLVAGLCLAKRLAPRLCDGLDAKLWPLTTLAPLQYVGLGVWAGLVVGLLEVAHLAIRKYGFGIILKQPEHVVWLVPVCYLVLFGGVGSLAGLVRRLLPSVAPLCIVMFALVLLAAWSQMLMHPAIGQTATWVLCLGIAVQAARVATRHADGLIALVRRTTGWCVGVVLAAAAIAFTSAPLGERSALGALPPATAEAPNVLFIVLDTVRADHLTPYGYPRDTTPRLQALAEQSIVFEKLISSSPWTLPSHSTMFTGRYHYEISADWTAPLDDEHPTLAEELSARGYATAGFVGNLMYCLRENGLGRGFAHYEDFQLTWGTVALSTSIGKYVTVAALRSVVRELATNAADVISSRFLQWQAAAPDRPFFAFLNYIDAHGLYLAPKEYATRFGPRSPLLEQWYDREMWSPEEMQGFIDGYDACIAFIDDQIGVVLDALEERGEIENTIVVITGDHGELFGEHGLIDHGNSLYQPLIHVPLILSLPGATGGGTRVTTMVSLRDLAATILDLVGGRADSGIPGHSLARHWREPGAAASPSPLLAEISQGINTGKTPHSQGDMKSIHVDGVHYIVNEGNGREEVFDLRTDPKEERDIAADPRGQELLPKLREALQAALR